jgi:hypothetical protein
MKEVGIRELKNRLSEYVRQVRDGEVIMETAGELAQKYPALAEMARKGLVRLPLKAHRPGLYPRLPAVTPPGTAQRLLDEEREDRR